MSENLSLTQGNTFMISRGNGDIAVGSQHGLFHADTRFLSKYVVKIDRKEPELLGSKAVSDYEAGVYSSVDVDGTSGPRGVTLTRDRFVSGGVHDDLALLNHTGKPVELVLTIDFDGDFADIFEVKRGAVQKAARTTVSHSEEFPLIFSYTRGDVAQRTLISFSETPVITGKAAIFSLTLSPKEEWRTCVDICVSTAARTERPQCRRGEFYKLVPTLNREKKLWLESGPKFHSDNDDLNHLYDRSITDLAALRLKFEDQYVIAAGMPWFMTLFGRDSLITALESMPISLDLAINVLKVLARYQADTYDDERDEEPGKIVHEVRFGESAAFQANPHSLYYGTIDATPLFLMLLGEVYKWTADLELVRELLPAAEAALAWIDTYGDLDGDGFVEYRRRSSGGLRNQGWKDSEDAVVFADGTPAEGAIALVEVQGYVYRAKLAAASLFRALGRTGDADALESRAAKLKKNFNDRFWLPEENYFAPALDGEKRRVDTITSNPGHCLWSGIIDAAKAPAVAERLLAADMFSGWGVRTMSAKMEPFSPLSYHNGSVWPHDNAILAAGLAAYGFHDEANRIILAMIESAANLPDYRLPELFAGYPRRPSDFPVPYPTASVPQAWAVGSAFLFIQTMLGLTADPEARSLKTKPKLPEQIGRLRLEHVQAFGRQFDVDSGNKGRLKAG